MYYTNNMLYPYYMYSIAGSHTYKDSEDKDVKIEGSSKNHWVHTPLINNQSIQTNNIVIPTTFTHASDKNAFRLWNNKNSNGDAKVKSPHDPCPPGYIIEVSNFGYWWVNENSIVEGIARNPNDDSEFTAGYRVYGMFYDATDANGNPTSMYLPCAGNRYEMKISRTATNNWANMGYLYFYNTDGNSDKESNVYEYYSGNSNKFTGVGFTNVAGTGIHKTWKAANIQYGARNSGALAKVYRNTGKTVNAQAYNVRCIKQANN